MKTLNLIIIGLIVSTTLYSNHYFYNKGSEIGFKYPDMSCNPQSVDYSEDHAQLTRELAEFLFNNDIPIKTCWYLGNIKNHCTCSDVLDSKQLADNEASLFTLKHNLKNIKQTFEVIK